MRVDGSTANMSARGRVSPLEQLLDAANHQVQFQMLALLWIQSIAGYVVLSFEWLLAHSRSVSDVTCT